MARRLTWILIPAVILVVAAVWFSFKRSHSKSPTSVGLTLPPPLANRGFADGQRVELLQVALDSIQHGAVKPAPGGLLDTALQEKVTSAYAMNSNPRISRSTSDGWKSLDSISFKSRQPAPLLIEFRWLDPQGQIKRPKYAFDAGRVTLFAPFDHGNPTNWSGGQCLDAESIIRGSVSHPRSDAPDILVQVSDGHGHWLSADGPVTHQEDPNGLCVAFLGTWPRDRPDLTIRFVTAGQAPLEFKVLNPAPPVTLPSPAWVPDTLPAAITKPEGTVTLERVESLPSTDGYPVLEPTITFAPAQEGAMGYEWELLEARDITGNIARFSSSAKAGDQGGLQSGFQLPPAPTPVRMLGQILPTEGCPRLRTEGVVIASGHVAPDGTPTLDITAEGKALGIDKVDASLLPEDPHDEPRAFCGHKSYSRKELPGDAGLTPRIYTLSLEGMIAPPGASTSPDRAKLGAAKDWLVVVFVNEEAESSGIYQEQGTSWTTSSTGPQQWSAKRRWFGRPAPGKKIEIAVVPPKPPVDVEFTIDRN